MAYGLIFAGGGTKGSYHIGVWRALDELGIDVTAVTGTSVGAINGAMYALGEYDRAVEMWRTISIDDVLKLPDEFISDNLFDIRNLPVLARELRKKAGLDTAPLEKMLTEFIDETRLRQSRIDYGLVTFSLTEKSGVTKFIKDIPEGRLIEYIMASAGLPVFKRVKIGGEVYADGAFYDNFPVNMLIERGYSDIIGVDVRGVGLVKSYNDSGRNIRIIRPQESVIGTMDFERENLGRNMQTGYYDTMAEFGHFVGDIYYIDTHSYYAAVAKYSRPIISGLERAASILGVEKLCGYRFDDFLETVGAAYESAKTKYSAQISDITEPSKIFERIRLKDITDERLILLWITAIMQTRPDFFDSKAVKGILGDRSKAASALMYFWGTVFEQVNKL